MEAEHKCNIAYQRNHVGLNVILLSIPLTSKENRRQNYGSSKLSCFQEGCQSWPQEDSHFQVWDQDDYQEDWGQGDQEEDWEEGEADDDQGRP